jgi:riboflavin synthase
MFTGIVKSVSKLKKAEKRGGSLFLTFEKPKTWKIKLGDSIATDGVCLTVAKLGRDEYTCELMTETLKKTYFGMYIPKRVNLEQALKFGDRVDGHFVLGHVDSVGEIRSISKTKRGALYAIRYPKKYAYLIVPKGSITVDGISLTIVDKRANYFSVSLVDYTLKNTSLGDKKKGSPVNLEFDIVGKYLLSKS